MTMTLEEKNKLLQANYEKLVLQYNILDRNYKDLCKTQEALAQPAQEPVAWATEWEDGEWSVSHSPNMGKQSIPLYTNPTPAQEPVGEYMQPIKPLVTAPSITISNTTSLPAPSWQGLSDDEIGYMWEILGDVKKFARAIEQALKEKNAI